MSENHLLPSGSPPYWPVGTQIMWREGDGPLGTGATVVDTSVPHFAQPVTVVRDDADGLVVWLPTGAPVLRAARADGLGKRDDQSTLFTAELVQERGVHAYFHQLRIAPTGRPWSVWVFFTEGTGEFAGWYVNFEKPHLRDEHTVYTSDHVLDLVIEPDRTMARKDEDELALAVSQGVFDATTPRRSRWTQRPSKPWSPTGVHHSATAGNASDPTLAGRFLSCLGRPTAVWLTGTGRRSVLDANAPVPSELRHPRFVATPLTTEIAALDYAAYMASPDVIRLHSDGRWPVDGFTLADDLEQVANHRVDHESHRAFTFTLLAPSRTEALGCLYLNSLREYLLRVGADQGVVDAFPPASAMVTFWLRQDQQDNGLAEMVVEAVNDWLLNDWPLDRHLFRVLPNERSSRRALERLSLLQIHLTLPGDERRPYLWYQPA